MMNKKKLELYIHIPFCKKKCGYCDFLSYAATTREQEEYVELLEREIENQGCRFGDYEVVSIFFGGGTPSILPGERIKTLMEKIYREFDVHPNSENSIECNPGTVTEKSLKLYMESGINRISFGLQSIENSKLKTLGRIHTFEEFLESYQQARSLGFQNINIDLMSALPGQTLKSWERTLTKITALEPEHISAYSLILEEGTPFYERYGEDESLLPDEDTEREMYHFTKIFLERQGYQHYEISNYAKDGYECRHNIGYWTGIEYLALGLGASSYVNGTRYRNSEDLQGYKTMVINQSEPIEVDVLTNDAKMEEFMFLGLRLLEGISIEYFENQFGQSLFSVYGAVIGELVEEGILKNDGSYIALTEKGLDLNNYAMAKFLL